MIVAETERLVLRRFTVEDTDFVLRLLNQPSFLENIGDKGVRTVEQAGTYLVEGPIRSYEKNGFGAYLVALKETGEPIGLCGLIRRDQFADPDVGYALLPEHWSRGYAFEAAAAAMEHGRRDLGMTKIIAMVKPGNTGSIRVLEKLGLAYSKNVRMEPDGVETALYE